MKINLTTTFYIILVGLLFTACGQNNSDKTTSTLADNNVAEPQIKTKKEMIADSIESIKQDSIKKVYEAEQHKKLMTAIKFAENDFFSSIKAVDRDFGENNLQRLSKILKQHKKTVYDIYVELTEIRKKAVSVARANGIEIRANGQERILSNYYFYLDKEMTAGENKFQNKYNFDNRLLLCFRNNYCSCLGDNSDKYCSGRQPIFPNGEFWNK